MRLLVPELCWQYCNILWQ